MYILITYIRYPTYIQMQNYNFWNIKLTYSLFFMLKFLISTFYVVNKMLYIILPYFFMSISFVFGFFDFILV